MSLLTHERAVDWVRSTLGGSDEGRHNGHHVRDPSGTRVRVAGRHIEGRMPLYFHLGAGLRNDEFDQAAVVLFEPDWSVRCAYAVSAETLAAIGERVDGGPARLAVGEAEAWGSEPPQGVVRLDA